jgi:hypothetical protein
VSSCCCTALSKGFVSFLRELKSYQLSALLFGKLIALYLQAIAKVMSMPVCKATTLAAEWHVLLMAESLV